MRPRCADRRLGLGGIAPIPKLGAAPSLSELAVTRVASMSMTSQPARVFPATASYGKPAGVFSIRSHT